MNQTITNEIREVMQAVHYRPAVSIFLPFETRLNNKNQLTKSLKYVTEHVEKELSAGYPAEMTTTIIRKLRNIFKDLDFNTTKKSLAVFISPVFEKLLYLDIPLEEKVIIDESFEIRDLVYSKKQFHQYLVLLLSQRESRIFLGNNQGFVRIASQTAFNDMSEVPERVANFSDVQDRKELNMDKFLQSVDHSLEEIIRTYQLPIFVLGADKTIGHFRQFSKHSGSVIAYIPGNYERIILPELKELLAPYLLRWNEDSQKNLLKQLDDAASHKKLATGMVDVWREAMAGKGRLLVVEKNYMYAASHGESPEIIEPMTESITPFSCIRDAVDDVLEKVLEGGGDVEFVNEGVLDEYRKIALVQYY
ncbi:MAG: hypothetical protein IPI66_10795 [Chitinophagaceae bacterium]|nr:hypothetical protein [Chitinophagaceae bacterium]MBL0056517.1 hypothetical protein [Chitinophagaceae bacterium]